VGIADAGGGVGGRDLGKPGERLAGDRRRRGEAAAFELARAHAEARQQVEGVRLSGKDGSHGDLYEG
jgi:hypothetical protein